MKKIVTETKTVIINTKTNEQFVSAEESVEESKVVITLTREDGTTKEVAPSTFKRWYKSAEIQVEAEIEIPEESSSLEKPEAANKHQKDAKRNIYHGYNWVVGGHENELSDYGTEMPSVEDLFQEIYDEVTSGTFGEGSFSLKAPICMKFAGKEFIKKYIAYLLTKDGYSVPEKLYKVAPKKTHTGNVDNVRRDEADKTVTMYAFTGMLIGIFEVTGEDSESYTVEDRHHRTLKFSKETGKQLNCSKPQFANRIAV